MLFCSVVKSCPTPWTVAHWDPLSFTVSQSLLKFMSTELVSLSKYLNLCCTLLLFPLSPSAFYLSQNQGLFQWVRSLHQGAKVLELWPQHQPFRWMIRVDFFRIDWFGLLGEQGALSSLLLYHNSKASALSAQPPLQSNSHIRRWLLEKPQLWPYRPCWQSDVFFLIHCLGASLIAQLVKNPPEMQEIPGLGRSAREGIGYPTQYSWASLVVQLVKNPLTWGKPRFNPWVWKILWIRERLLTPVFWTRECHGHAQSMGSQGVGHDWAAFTFT